MLVIVLEMRRKLTLDEHCTAIIDDFHDAVDSKKL
jgi:hypothetical protein